MPSSHLPPPPPLHHLPHPSIPPLPHLPLEEVLGAQQAPDVVPQLVVADQQPLAPRTHLQDEVGRKKWDGGYTLGRLQGRSSVERVNASTCSLPRALTPILPIQHPSSPPSHSFILLQQPSPLHTASTSHHWTRAECSRRPCRPGRGKRETGRVFCRGGASQRVMKRKKTVNYVML